MKAYGVDAGTYNFVVCTRDENNNFVYKREVNAFLKIPINDGFTFSMMKAAGVPLIERENVAYALGEAAVKIAYDMDKELKRPMKDGCVNPKEKDAYEIMSIMLHSLVGNITEDKAKLCYCVPANAINQETDAEHHQKVLEAIFKAYRSEDGKGVDAIYINEAQALVYAELAHKSYTGIGISFGSGMVNVCYASFGQPVFKFAIANSGDWIDYQAAKATGESPTFINQEKMKIDLSQSPSGMVERAIQTQYRLMVEKTITGIKKGIVDANFKVRNDKAIDIIIAGGVSLPNGFPELFKEVLDQAEMHIKVNEIKRPDDALFSVARGTLLSAEAAIKN